MSYFAIKYVHVGAVIASFSPRISLFLIAGTLS